MLIMEDQGWVPERSDFRRPGQIDVPGEVLVEKGRKLWEDSGEYGRWMFRDNGVAAESVISRVERLLGEEPFRGDKYTAEGKGRSKDKKSEKKGEKKGERKRTNEIIVISDDEAVCSDASDIVQTSGVYHRRGRASGSDGGSDKENIWETKKLGGNLCPTEQGLTKRATKPKQDQRFYATIHPSDKAVASSHDGVGDSKEWNETKRKKKDSDVSAKVEAKRKVTVVESEEDTFDEFEETFWQDDVLSNLPMY